MKRFFSIVLCVCIVVSVFAVSASAYNYSFDWSVNDNFSLDQSSISGKDVINRISIVRNYAYDKTPGPYYNSGNAINNNWGSPLFVNHWVSNTSKQSMQIVSEKFVFPYNATALNYIRFNLSAVLNTVDYLPYGIEYRLVIRQEDASGRRWDQVKEGLVGSSYGGNVPIDITMSNQLDPDDPYYFSLVAGAVSIRIYLTFSGYGTYDNLTDSLVWNAPLTLYSLDQEFLMSWDTDEISLQYVDTQVDDINQGINGDNYTGIGGSSADVDELESELNEVMDNALYGDYRDTVFLFTDITQQDYMTNLLQNQLGSSFAFIRDTVDMATRTEDINSGYERPNILGLLVQIALTLGVAGASLGIVVQSVSSRRFGVSHAETSSKSSSRFLALPSSRKRGGTS